MEIIIILLIYLLIIYVIARKNATQTKRIDEENKKLKQAIRDGDDSYVSYWNRVGAVRVDVDTGERYVDKMIGSHECRFSPNGKLLHDFTQEKLDRELKGERKRALKEGRRFYVVDNRIDNRQVYCGGSKMSHICQGARVKDILTGKIYVIRFTTTISTKECSMEEHYPVLVDPETMIIYDVINQKRPYLEGEEYMRMSVDLGIKLHNWHSINNKREIIRKYTWVCELESVPRNGLSVVLSNIDVRPEFKHTKYFPIELPDEPTIKNINRYCDCGFPYYCKSENNFHRYNY